MKMKAVTDAELFGRCVAAARGLAGLQQHELASEASISPATISNCERGTTFPRPENRKAIRKALKSNGVTLSCDYDNGNVMLAAHFKLV